MSAVVADLERTPSRLETQRLGRSLHVLESTASTMDDARLAFERGAIDGHVVVADTQTAGRGTHGRLWSSPAGSDLYFSIVMRPDVALDVLPTMTLAIGLGVARALERFTSASSTRIKWPNDVLVDGRKCAGILVESRAGSEGVEGVIVGIGINCNRTAFDVAGNLAPTSLRLARGSTVDRAEVLATVLLEVERAVDRWQLEGPESTAREVEQRLAFAGSRVLLDGREVVLLGVDRDGNLRVEHDGRVQHVCAGRLEPVGA